MKYKKIGIAVLVVALIALFASVANELVGNPVTKQLAKKAVRQYVDENYSDLNLELSEPHYNFKFDCYGVVVKSKTSVDTVFRVYTDKLGKIKEDDYKYEVANCFTTLRRLSSELDEKANEVISNKVDYDFDYISIRFIQTSKEEDEILSKLKLDMELDIYHPVIPLNTDVCIYTDDVSWNKIAEVGLALKQVLEDENIPITQYSIRLIPLEDKPKNEDEAVSWVNSLSISDFPSDRMVENNLPKVMEQFENDRVTTLNKNDKK